MHKRRVNELRLQLVIEPAGPILIKSGVESGADPTLPSMNFVRTNHPRSGRRTIYLPGSSLKGVIRSHSERILHTMLAGSQTRVCNPLSRNDNCASRLREQEIVDTAQQYRAMCPACRTFGHMTNASHFFSADAYPAAAIDELPVRQNVAIDRLSGGVAVGPFDMEVALTGKFGTRLLLYNFELWQVGLLALALRDIAAGRVRVGFAKSRGLGEVRLYLAQMEVSYPGRFGGGDFAFDQTLYGVGALAPDLLADYGYVGADDRVAYGREGHMDESGAVWGRPSIRFGLAGDDPEGQSTPTLEASHQEIMGVLTSTMAPWTAFIRQQGGVTV